MSHKHKQLENQLLGQIWIAVESDKGDEWVLLWTNEEYTDAEGKTKKIAAQESFQIKDGKIIRVNQFQKPNNNQTFLYFISNKKSPANAGLFL